jgi:hypothetical protein
MLHKRFFPGVFWAAVLTCVPAALAAQDDTGEQYSDAQIALFRTPHLDNVTRPTTLEYDYRHDAAQDDSFVDTVKMTVTEISPDGGKSVTFEYLTGSHARSFQDLTNFRGNPLIMIFLEDDVRRMKEELGGGGVYMRNRIRHAFYDRGQTQPVTFELNGRKISGTQVTIAPFVGDKNRERLGDNEHKTYEFVVSPDVPGGIYRIRSTVPSSSAAAKPLAQDTLTYRGGGS